MAIIKIFVKLSIILSVATSIPLYDDGPAITTTENKRANYLLPTDTSPTHYDVRLIPHLVENNFTFDGEIDIDFEVLRPTKNVVLHSKKLKIDESATKLKCGDDHVLVPQEHRYDEEFDFLILSFKEPLTPGICRLSLNFTGILNDGLYGFYRSSYVNENNQTVWLALTHFQKITARRAFPCWDEPALKATFDISMKHYPNYTALSNMPMREQTEVDKRDGKLWTHFQTTPLMSTNIVAFVLSDYESVSNADGTIKVWCWKSALPNVKYFLEIAEKATAELEKYTNSTVGVPKMDHVVIPQYSSRATENWGLVLYLKYVIIREKGEDTYADREATIQTAIHEMVHMWFGNLVSPSSWEYYWMSEGFATYLKYVIMDKIYSNYRIMDLYVVRSLQENLLTADTSPYVHAIHENIATPNVIWRSSPITTYEKAGAVLRMASHCVTENVFHEGVLEYLDRHKYSSVSSDDLWRAMQDALDASDLPHGEVTVKEVMDSWTDQPGYPLVTVTRDYATGETKLTQEVFNPKGYLNNGVNSKWWIPVSFATKSNPDFSSTVPTRWLRPQDEFTKIEDIDANDWIIVNIQQTGLYRVNYEDTNWRAIAKHLNSDNYTDIHVLNRAQIISDASNFVTMDRLNPVIFYEILNYLWRETDYIPWFPATRIMYILHWIIPMTEYAPSLRNRLLHFVDHVVESVGFEVHPDDEHVTRLIRLRILELACRYGHSLCREQATAQLEAFLQNPDTSIESHDLASWIFCEGLRDANETIWLDILAMYKEKQSIDTLRTLACVEDPYLVEKYLNMTISDDSPILEADKLEAISYIFQSSPSNFDIALEFGIKHLENVFLSNPHMFNRVIGDSFLSRRQLDKIKPLIPPESMTLLMDKEKLLSRVEKSMRAIHDWIEQQESDSEELRIYDGRTILPCVACNELENTMVD